MGPRFLLEMGVVASHPDFQFSSNSSWFSVSRTMGKTLSISTMRRKPQCFVVFLLWIFAAELKPKLSWVLTESLLSPLVPSSQNHYQIWSCFTQKAAHHSWCIRVRASIPKTPITFISTERGQAHVHIILVCSWSSHFSFCSDYSELNRSPCHVLFDTLQNFCALHNFCAKT